MKGGIFIGLWGNIFKKKDVIKEKNTNSMISISSQSSMVFGQGVNSYQNRLVRSCIDRISSLIASTPLKYYKKNTSGLNQEEKLGVIYLLNERPNSALTGYDLKVQWISRYLLYNNSYIWVRKNKLGEPIELYPIISDNAELITTKEDPQFLFLKFTLKDGTMKILPYDEILHLRKDFSDKDFFGDNNKPLAVVADINDKIWENLVQWANNVSFIKGFFQSDSVLRDSDIEEAKARFAKVLSSSSKGIEVIDGKFKYVPVTAGNQIMDPTMTDKVKKEVYDFFGINEDILTGKATPLQIESFHKLTLQPIFTQIESELNKKLTTFRQNATWDRRFKFQCSTFEHMIPSEKVASLQFLTNLGAITINEIREQYGFDRIEGGDKLMYSKNYAEVGKTDETTKDKEEIDSSTEKEKEVEIKKVTKEEEEEEDAK